MFLIEELTCGVGEVVETLGAAVGTLEDVVDDLSDDLRSKWGMLEQEMYILRASEARLKELLEQMASEA
jgi:hypothetical protein